MKSPYEILGVLSTDSDEHIRNRYLELIRQYVPERFPEEFRQIRFAYDQVSTEQKRVTYLLFEEGKEYTVQDVIQEVIQNAPRERFSLEQLLTAYQKSDR